MKSENTQYSHAITFDPSIFRGRDGSGNTWLRRMRLQVGLVILVGLVALSGCTTVNFSLIFPAQEPPAVTSWSEQRIMGELKVNYEWAAPRGTGPFPTIVIQPGIDTTAQELRAAVWDLASRGYVAVAVGYLRNVNGTYESVRFPLRAPRDIKGLVEPIRAEPRVDQSRMGLLGFSRGAAYSLLLAAEVPEFRTAVAYYPITDFPRWVDERAESSALWRFAFKVVRWQNRNLEQGTDKELRQLLYTSSPVYRVGDIKLPVLFIHGDRDSVAPLRDSATMNSLMNARCDCSELMVVNDAEHSFNFKDPASAANAWYATLEWFSRYLKSTTI